MSKKIWSILGNSQKLDGGAMFGNAPKALWSKWIQSDEQNRIPLACRALLIQEQSGRLILCETGIGAFFDPSMKQRFGVQENEHVLLNELNKLGISPEQIDVVVLSHLHFDHAGGLLSAFEEGKQDPPTLVFTKAQFVIGQRAWDRAQAPHERDKASFIPALLPLLRQSQRVELIGDRLKSKTLGEDYSFIQTDGHTPGQLHLKINGKQPVLFCGDLIPGAFWLHVPITMGYDRFPEQLIEEKKMLLSTLKDENCILFFTHDHQYAMAHFELSSQGKFVMTQAWNTVNEFILED